MSAMRWSRPADTRLVPFSYFCTCWNVNPMPSARLDCDRPRSNLNARNLASDFHILGTGATLPY